MRYLFLFALVIFLSCEVKVGTKTDDSKGVRVANKDKIRNGIKIKTSGGVTVEQAFLTYAVDGGFVDESNITGVNKAVKINLVVKGWKGTSDKIYIDAQQKVTTNEGDLVLDKKDMLAEAGEISPKDAEFLNFQVVITKLNKIYDYFLVEVRATNKGTDQSLEASFKIHIE